MSRLPAPFGSAIERERPLAFRFDGRRYRGYAGDSIASALWANGVRMLSRSFKYHRPRGPVSFAGAEANTLVQLPGRPNVPADLEPLVDGLEVLPQNVRGSLARDRWRHLDRFAALLPAGFYYRAFFRPRGAWRFWEPRIRAMAGLGKVDVAAPRQAFAHDHAFTDVAVIGGGAAGMAAALAAAAAGARVELIDDAPRLGGALRFARLDGDGSLAPARLDELTARIAAEPRINVRTATTANGWFADHWLALLHGRRNIRLRAKATVVATGAQDQPAVFRHNDRPGVLLASGAQRLIRLYGVRPGRRAVVLTGNGEGYGAALDLADAGVDVAAVLDLRAGPADDPRLNEVERRGIAVRPGHGVLSALSNRAGDRLSGVEVVPLAGDGTPSGREQRLACDLVCVSVGAMPTAHLLLHGGARLAYDEAVGGFDIATPAAGVVPAGAVNGRAALEACLADGDRAGRLAAAHAGYDAGAAGEPPSRSAGGNHPYPVLAHPKGKEFVDLDEDQCIADVARAIDEGFRDVELIKRYTTAGMGPSQGKLTALNLARLAARLRGEAVAAVGVTTMRPPYRPEPLGQLAGPGFHPTRRGVLHDRHLEAGAQMLLAGAWLRPAWYGAAADREACIAAEAGRVRAGVGLIDVSTLGGLEVRGPDAAALLERLYTGRFRRQPVGRIRYALMCDRTGTIVDDGVACRLADDHFYLTATTGAVDGVYREMLRWNAEWQLRVDVANVTAAYAGISVAGPRAREVLAALPGDVDLSADGFPYLHLRQGRIAGVPCRLLRVGFVGELCYELHLPASQAEAVWDALLAAGGGAGIAPVGIDAQRLLRLEKGHILIGQDTDGLSHPLEAGLGWAIGRDKRYFVGQRAIAIQAGHGIERRLVGFTLPADAPLPAECHLVVRDGAIAGRVTSVARSPLLGHTIGLAYVAPDQAEPDSRFEIKLGDGRMVGATVAPLPFFDPDNARQAG